MTPLALGPSVGHILQMSFPGGGKWATSNHLPHPAALGNTLGSSVRETG